MANFNTPSTLNGMFKTRWSKDVKNLIPACLILQKRIPFQKATLVGANYEIPVILADEQGFSYGDGTGTAYALNDSIAMQMQPAVVQAYEMTLQSGVSYTAVTRSSQKGEQAVENVIGRLIMQMKGSAGKRLEIQMIYGQSPTGLGSISAHSGSGTTRVYTISSATWAHGTFAGLKNAQLDSIAAGAVVNTNSAIIITKVDPINKQLTVSGNSTDLTALDAASTPYFVFYGSFGKEMVGLDKIALNTGSLFSIDASVYDLWQAQTVDCQSAELSMAKVLTGSAIATARGLLGKATLYVAPDSYANLNSDLSAQRQIDESYDGKKGENGYESLSYHYQGGVLEVVSHSMVKSGDAFLLQDDSVDRVGSTDFDFHGENPDGESSYLYQNQSNNGWATRGFSDQCIVHTAPCQMVKFINIVPTV